MWEENAQCVMANAKMWNIKHKATQNKSKCEKKNTMWGWKCKTKASVRRRRLCGDSNARNEELKVAWEGKIAIVSTWRKKCTQINDNRIHERCAMCWKHKANLVHRHHEWEGEITITNEKKKILKALQCTKKRKA
jgi:hypothetical protein